MAESFAGTARAVSRLSGHEPARDAGSGAVEQLSDAVAESVRLQAQLNERFAVRLAGCGCCGSRTDARLEDGEAPSAGLAAP